MNKEAMKLALEALKIAQNNLAPSKHSAHAFGDGELWDMYADAIKALEEALAKQEQGEPVAHINQNGVIHEAGYPWGIHNTLEPLYRHPPQQRTWVELTDEEIRACIASNKYAFEIVRAAEAKLKEKNT